MLCGLEADGFDDTFEEPEQIASVVPQKRRQAAGRVEAVDMPSKFARVSAGNTGGDVPVIIGRASNAGKGLFASRDILEGEVIFVEEAAVCAQVHAQPVTSSGAPALSVAAPAAAADFQPSRTQSIKMLSLLTSKLYY